ncbi:hypothetical protein [Halopiger xanaduensis]|uniref:DUF8149 domain-containing protein n=1 Tax=Halopiger xanaduensis (strain DSM 18323 / JCM 14033 / SH-6) TaxID=797210 RepID=F8D4W0_HALXS|nr:hypothetical protein [Halopiger xanaduensis]AEH37587.1 hypothetical protein Halxa_2971 [Halopiger xanaduensis SH-6]
MAPADPDDDPRVPVVCPECETTSRVPLTDLAETVERHNDQLHDGEDVAEVDPDVADHIADLIATELGLLDDAE